MLAALTNYPAIAGKTAAGGNQNLFSQKSLQLCGCGIVAALEGGRLAAASWGAFSLAPPPFTTLTAKKAGTAFSAAGCKYKNSHDMRWLRQRVRAARRLKG